MTGSITFFALQQYWWVIISLLAGFLVFLMFVQGGQTLIYSVGKTLDERKLLVNTLGRKWELTFTTLVTFGGAFFASFPLFYSTSFGGAYWVWIIILFAFIVQAVAYEYRTKPGNFLGRGTYEFFLLANGAIGSILVGTAVATFYTGSAFSVNKMNLTDLSGLSHPVISVWQTPWHGLEALLNPMNVALGLAVFCLVRILGAMYFMNSVNNDNVFHESRKQVVVNGIPFLLFFLYFVIRLMTIPGNTYHPETGLFSTEPAKYLHNFIRMPWLLILFLAGVVLVLSGLYAAIFRNSGKAIWFAGTGTVVTVFSLFLLAGLNHTSYYPSSVDLQSSLSIENSSSSFYTLKVMSVVSLLVPIVLAYIFAVWKIMNRDKVDLGELNEETHVY